MVKRCAWGTCNTDSRYPDRLEGGVFFVPFPKPKTKLAECKRWIGLCRRPKDQLNVKTITKDTYVCSKHFRDGKPTLEHPDPILYAAPKIHRPSPKKRTQHRTQHRKTQINPRRDMSNNEREGQVVREPPGEERPPVEQPPPEEEGGQEERDDRSSVQRAQIESQKSTDAALRQRHVPNGLTPEITRSHVPTYFQYVTGFTSDQFNHLCTVWYT